MDTDQQQEWGSQREPDSGVHSPPRALPRSIVLLSLLGLLAGGIMAAAILLNPAISAAGSGPAAGGVPTPVPDRVAEGEPAPDFTATTAEGEPITLSDLRGRPVVLNFWATWCAPCRVEMPALQGASERYADSGLIILAVNAMEPADRVSAYMQELGLTFPAVLDPDGAVLDLYGIRVFPTTVVIDAGGRVQAQHYGPLTDDLIDEYMALVAGGTAD